jgi:hypothetical protein
MKHNIETMIAQIEAWKERLGYEAEFRKEKAEYALTVASSVMWPLTWGYRKAIKVFEDLFEDCMFISMVNYGQNDEYELDKLAEAIYEIDRYGGFRPEFLDEKIDNVYVHASFCGLKANTGESIEFNFHLNADLGQYGYTITFNDRKLWESGYDKIPDTYKIDELVLECLKTTFETIQSKANQYA